MLSAGQRRRVALAGVLLASAALWLLDEPTTNLDADGQQLVAALIDEQLGARRHRRGRGAPRAAAFRGTRRADLELGAA